MKIIILILAHDDKKYTDIESLWRQYMNKHENIRSYFIKARKNTDGIHVLLEDDTFYINCEESFKPGCLIKTVESIRYLLNNGEEFDYILRTNLSSVIHLDNLYSYLCNRQVAYAGNLGEYFGIYYASGSGILMQRKVCEILIMYEKYLQYQLPDDVAIGKFFQDIKIFVIGTPRFEAYIFSNHIDLLDYDFIKDYYHIRCKTDKEHTKTFLLMKKVISLIYS